MGSDFEESCGFYSSSNVLRIKCELGGVGIYFVHLLWGFKGERLRLEPVQRYSYYEDIRKDSKKSIKGRKIFNNLMTLEMQSNDKSATDWNPIFTGVK